MYQNRTKTAQNRPEPPRAAQNRVNSSRSDRFTLEVLQKSKYRFPCSIRITFFFASHPAPRSFFCFFAPLCGETLKKKRAFYVRGVVKCKNVLPMLRKNHFFFSFSCSARLVFLRLNTPLRRNAWFLRGADLGPSFGLRGCFRLCTYLQHAANPKVGFLKMHLHVYKLRAYVC